MRIATIALSALLSAGCTVHNLYPTEDKPIRITDKRVTGTSWKKYELLLNNPGSPTKAWQTVTKKEYEDCQKKEYYPTCVKRRSPSE